MADKINSDLEDFLSEDSLKTVFAEIKFPRFKAPVKIKSIDGENTESFRKECWIIDRSSRASAKVFDYTKWNNGITARSIVTPNLSNAEFQDKLGVKTPEAAFLKLFRIGEQDILVAKAMEVNGYSTQALNEDVETAKN